MNKTANILIILRLHTVNFSNSLKCKIGKIKK